VSLAVTKLTLTVTYLLIKGIRESEAEYVASQKLETRKKINSTLDSKKEKQESKRLLAKLSRAMRTRRQET
jgi:hypothetical protein